MKLDRAVFFKGIRQGPFPGTMNAGQVRGIEAILDEFERRGWDDLRELAYMLATTKWETAHRMQPIREIGGNAYFQRMYDIKGARPKVAKALGNTLPGDGIKYHGRGFVQLTGKGNYTKLQPEIRKIFEVDIVENPDETMKLPIASYIMFEGMQRGIFTGKRLDHYFNEHLTDWKNARKIINGLDHADDIAALAKQFYVDLQSATVGEKK